jgi:hypothetical protein
MGGEKFFRAPSPLSHPTSVRPELVEGLSFFCHAEWKGVPFDKLRTNGFL